MFNCSKTLISVTPAGTWASGEVTDGRFVGHPSALQREEERLLEREGEKAGDMEGGRGRLNSQLRVCVALAMSSSTLPRSPPPYLFSATSSSEHWGSAHCTPSWGTQNTGAGGYECLEGLDTDFL